MASEQLNALIGRLHESYPQTKMAESNESSLKAALEANSEAVFDAMDQELRNIQISSALGIMEDFASNPAMVKKYGDMVQGQLQLIEEYLALCDKYLATISAQGPKRERLTAAMQQYRQQLPEWRARRSALLSE